MDKKQYELLTDKYMLQLLELFQVDIEDSSTLEQLGTIVCNCVLEAMTSNNRPYIYEVGILEKTAGIINGNMEQAANRTDIYWNMRAGFTTEEEARRYKEQLTDGRPSSLFINGIPIDQN